MLLAIPVAVVVYFLNKDRVPGNMPPGPEQSILFGNFKVMNVYSYCLFVFSVYIQSLPVGHLSDAPRRRLVFTGDRVRIQDETTESSA